MRAREFQEKLDALIRTYGDTGEVVFVPNGEILDDKDEVEIDISFDTEGDTFVIEPT